VVFRPSLDLPGNFGGNSAQTIQQYVSVAQQNPDVMVVRVPHLPQHLAVPVGFQDDAAFERKAAEKVVL
jgi:hypothetical protein